VSVQKNPEKTPVSRPDFLIISLKKKVPTGRLFVLISIGVPITFFNIRFQKFFVSLLSYAVMFVLVEIIQTRVVFTV